MAFFAIIIMDENGEIVGLQPKGSQFQEEFLKSVSDEEKQSQTPHPNVFDMGGYYLHSLWSGKEPFIILPEYIVGIVSDASEDKSKVKRNLRKIANNVLLYYKNDKKKFRAYLEEVWEKIETKKFSEIELKKPEDIESEDVGDIKAQPSSDDSFDDLLEITSSQTSQINKEAEFDKTSQSKNTPSDPFGGPSSSGSDPFGSTTPNVSSDPFGGGSSQDTSDPFAQSSSPSHSQEKSSGLDYDPSLFESGSSSSSATSQDDDGEKAFSDNPWADIGTEDDEEKEDEEDVDPFASDPFS